MIKELSEDKSSQKTMGTGKEDVEVRYVQSPFGSLRCSWQKARTILLGKRPENTTQPKHTHTTNVN